MKLMNREPTEEMVKAACTVKGMSLGSYREWWIEHYQAMYDSAPEIKVDMEPSRPLMYFCNKCGYYGDSGPSHVIPIPLHGNLLPNSTCGYYATPNGPWYSSEQVATLQAEIERLTAQRDNMIAALKPILTISDRKHDAWDHAHALIAKYEGEKES